MNGNRAPIDEATVRHMARLARLGLDASTLAIVGPQLGAVVEMVAGLDAVATSGVLPAVLSGESTRYRPADTGVIWPPNAHVANAPEASGTAFRVPRVV